MSVAALDRLDGGVLQNTLVIQFRMRRIGAVLRGASRGLLANGKSRLEADDAGRKLVRSGLGCQPVQCLVQTASGAAAAHLRVGAPSENAWASPSVLRPPLRLVTRCFSASVVSHYYTAGVINRVGSDYEKPLTTKIGKCHSIEEVRNGSVGYASPTAGLAHQHSAEIVSVS